MRASIMIEKMAANVKDINVPSDAPYIDMKDYKELDPDERYRTIIGTPGSTRMFQENMAPMQNALWMATKHIFDRMSENGISCAKVCQITGIDASNLTRGLKGERPLSVAPRYIEQLCYSVAQESCQQVYLGEEARLKLWGLYEIIGSGLGKLPVNKLNQLNALAEQAEIAFAQSREADEITGHLRTETELIRDRIKMLSEGSSRTTMDLLPNGTPFVVRKRIRSFVVETSQWNVHSDILLYIALEMKVPLDFFVAEHMRDDVKIMAKGKPLKSKAAQFIRTAFALPEKERVELLGVALGALRHIS